VKEGAYEMGTLVQSLITATLAVAVVAGCVPTQFHSASNPDDVEMARARWECEREFRENLALSMATNPYGGGAAFGKRWFIINCMKARGYEVAR
jgi:hypothetical protein